MLGYPRSGTFIEIGAYHSHDLSNTVLLEDDYFWLGLAFEIDPIRCTQYRANRLSGCIEGDATKIDYPTLFAEHGFVGRVDYLQLDIEPAEQTLRALKALPLADYRFSVITYETDVYVAGDGPQKEAFEILSDFGYTRAVKNVAFQGNPFEDWYVDRDHVDLDALAKIMDNSDEPKESSKIIARLGLSSETTFV
jgi:hypothetical protein